MLGLGSIGNIGGLIGSVIALGIMAIILLTFAPTVAGDINGIFLQGKDTCEYQSERFNKVVLQGTYTNADDAWYESTTTSVIKKAASGTGCASEGALAANTSYYTPKGTVLPEITTSVTAGADLPASWGTWETASKSVEALAGGSLALLILGAMGILLPAGAIGFLTYVGADMVRGYMGGSVLAIAIGATVTTVVVGAILPEIFSPLDRLFIVMDGGRYLVYNEGIGKLAGVLSNFFAISLLAGLVALGAMLWKNTKGNEEGVM